jgi:uncharacterized membrane protein
MVNRMEPIIPTQPVILQTPSIVLIGLLVGIAIITGATALVFVSVWEKKRRQTIC